MKIGILGGTFNPIHNGHLILAQNAFEACGLDKVLIMPSGVSYFKDPKEIASTHNRIEMVKHAISGNENFELSTIETDRNGNSYTFETIELLKAANPNDEYYYIIGADTLFSMESWKKPDIIFNNCKIICAPRDLLNNDKLISKKLELEQKYTTEIIILDCPEIAISSTIIRNMFFNNKSAKYYLPEEERLYIKENNIYDKNI